MNDWKNLLHTARDVEARLRTYIRRLKRKAVVTLKGADGDPAEVEAAIVHSELAAVLEQAADAVADAVASEDPSMLEDLADSCGAWRAEWDDPDLEGVGQAEATPVKAEPAPPVEDAGVRTVSFRCVCEFSKN